MAIVTAFNCIGFTFLSTTLFHRIDGALANLTARFGQKMMINNGTVLLDIQKTFSSESDETGVMLISLQYESGLLGLSQVPNIDSFYRYSLHFFYIGMKTYRCAHECIKCVTMINLSLFVSLCFRVDSNI